MSNTEPTTQPFQLNEEQIDKIMAEMQAKEAAQTYKMLHIFDNEIVILRGKEMGIKTSYNSVSGKCDAVLNAIVTLSKNAFTKHEIKTVNISNDSNIVVFVKDKKHFDIKYSDFNSAIIEELVTALKAIK
jgi:hypothetical protein